MHAQQNYVYLDQDWDDGMGGLVLPMIERKKTEKQVAHTRAYQQAGDEKLQAQIDELRQLLAERSSSPAALSVSPGSILSAVPTPVLIAGLLGAGLLVKRILGR